MYEAHFGLAQLPFRLAPDPRFYVDTAPHRAAIEALRDEFCHGDEFIALLGDFGTGKTTIARRLLEEVHDGRHLIGELPGMRIDGDELFDRVHEALGLPEAESPGAADGLVRQLEALARGGRDALLLVDDAHRLQLDALARLRTLTSVRVDGRAALHVTLVGRSLPAGIEQLRDGGRPLDIGAPVRVETLDVAGTRDYILERLGRAGWTGRPAFDPGTTAEIHALCDGNPGRINRLCGHVLLQLFMEGRDDLNPDIVRAVDELLRLELEGKPATAKLPPPAPAGRPVARLRESSAANDVAGAAAGVDLALVSPAARMPATLRGAAGREVVALPAAPLARPPSPARRLVKQGLVAAALLVGGGVLWQTVYTLAVRHATQARLATAAAAATPAPALALARTPAPTAPSTAARPAADDVVALAERTLAQAPPAAGAPRPVAAAIAAPAAVVAPAAVADTGGRQHAHPTHRNRSRPTTVAAQPPAPAVAPCALESEALGLCTRARARAPVHAAAAETPMATVRDATPEATRPAPPLPACDPTRAALALCN
ncbi:MAG TPA: AAA family ATPase [Burkholderiaceae bacterium]